MTELSLCLCNLHFRRADFNCMCVNHKPHPIVMETVIPMKSQMINLAAATEVLLLQFTETA